MTLSTLIIRADEWDFIRATLSEPEPVGVLGLKIQTSRFLPAGWYGTVDDDGTLRLYRPETEEPDSA